MDGKLKDLLNGYKTTGNRTAGHLFHHSNYGKFHKENINRMKRYLLSLVIVLVNQRVNPNSELTFYYFKK